MSSTTEFEGFSGLRVLAVEDEALVALNLEGMLLEIGCEVAALAMRYEQVEAALASNDEIGAAVLDVNLGGRTIFPLAEQIAQRDVPIVFATGYGAAGLPERWQGWPVIQKPYMIEDLSRALRQAVGSTLGA